MLAASLGNLEHSFDVILGRFGGLKLVQSLELLVRVFFKISCPNFVDFPVDSLSHSDTWEHLGSKSDSQSLKQSAQSGAQQTQALGRRNARSD